MTGSTSSSNSDDLMAQRYGVGRSRFSLLGRRFGMGTVIGIVVAAVFAVTMVWVIVANTDPDTQIKVMTFDVLDEHEVTTDVNVVIKDGLTGTVTCTVAAGAVDGANVGETTFKPLQGRQTITIRTDREATTVDERGCTVTP